MTRGDTSYWFAKLTIFCTPSLLCMYQIKSNSPLFIRSGRKSRKSCKVVLYYAWFRTSPWTPLLFPLCSPLSGLTLFLTYGDASTPWKDYTLFSKPHCSYSRIQDIISSTIHTKMWSCSHLHVCGGETTMEGA